ncbi:hypothetical protein [Rhizobium alvei]|uniref:DUF3800 domain-containing protein n=1 Tax=Rhizobium alvei TaxID=1132659 RepID=A0ABT8YQ09_9HYPH|nr:hypothetical protein [Rhizobium alvei]MDO6965787.1 hypothetical protein [Rhizobium alvei]
MTTNPKSQLRVYLDVETEQNAFIAPRGSFLMAAGVAIARHHDDRPHHVFTMFGLAPTQDWFRMGGLAEAIKFYDTPETDIVILSKGMPLLATIVARNGVRDEKKQKLYDGHEWVVDLKSAIASVPRRWRQVKPEPAYPQNVEAVALRAARFGLERAREASIASDLDLSFPRVWGKIRLPELEGSDYWKTLRKEEDEANARVHTRGG